MSCTENNELNNEYADLLTMFTVTEYYRNPEVSPDSLTQALYK